MFVERSSAHANVQIGLKGKGIEGRAGAPPLGAATTVDESIQKMVTEDIKALKSLPKVKSPD